MDVKEALDVLGLAKVPTAEELRQVYRDLVKRYHPDVSRGGTGERMALINEAYLVVMRYISEKKSTPSEISFTISAQSLARLISALDEYAVSPAMFKLIYRLKGSLQTYYTALKMGKPRILKEDEPFIKKAYIYLQIFRKVEEPISVLPPDIRHSFMYRLGEFLAGEHWENLGEEVNTLLDAYFRAYSLIVTLEGTERASMPTLPPGEGAEVSPLGTFSAMSISGKIRSFAARLRLLLEPRVFKMPHELLREVEEIGRYINDLISIVNMAVLLQKKLSSFRYYGPWMMQVKGVITRLVAGAVAIGDRDVDMETLRALYENTMSVLERMEKVKGMARKVASIFYKAGSPTHLVEYAEKVARGEGFTSGWDDIRVLLDEYEGYMNRVISIGGDVIEAGALMKELKDKIGCLQCPDIEEAYNTLSERLWGRLSPPMSAGTEPFLVTTDDIRTLLQFIDVMSLGECDVAVGVMMGVVSSELLLRKMGRE